MMTKIVSVAFAALIVVTFVTAEDSDEFKKWKDRFQKTYSDKSVKCEAAARKTFEENKAAIDKHNKDANATYTQKANAQTDMSKEEFEKYRTGLKSNKTAKSVRSSNGNDKALAEKIKKLNETSSSTRKNVKATGVADSLDYSSFMSPIKDQGQCGSCWAFAAIAVTEYWSAKSNVSRLYSEQNLVDCVKINAFGCNGGDPYAALSYAALLGVAEGSKYKYKAANGVCQSSTYPPVYKLPNAAATPLWGVEELLKTVLINYGPVVVTINASGFGFSSYSSGVYQSITCLPLTNHAVVLVGYGTDPQGGDYWLIRNSWGTGWGINGYGKIARNKWNMCGIANEVYGVLR